MLVDSIVYAGKVYPGVKIGDVDVSGMTVEQAADAAKSHYDEYLYKKTIYVFTDENAYNNVDLEDYFNKQDAVAEQISSLEQADNVKVFQTSASDLQAAYNYNKAAETATKPGHGINIFERLMLRIFGWSYDLHVDTGDGLEQFYSKVASTTGSPHVDYGIEVKDGNVTVTAGQDGQAVNRDSFIDSVTDSLEQHSDQPVKLLFSIEYDPVKINEEAANQTKTEVEQIISEGISLGYQGNDIAISKEQFGNWIATYVNKSANEWKLVPTINDNTAMQAISSAIVEKQGRIQTSLDITKDENGTVKINPVGDDPIPDVQSTVNTIKSHYFGTDIDRNKIEINDSTQLSDFSFEEALNLGLITEVSSFTTEFTNSTSTQNRNFNIRKVSDAINNTIISKNSGEFSFNTAAGPCDAAHGYLEAGAQVNGEVVQEAGGGICQVATTVFNAVYHAGYPITERHNHALRQLAYPDGLDAAVYTNDENPTWDNDLKWENDTDSDLILVTSYDDNSVTVKLYGTPNGRTVESIAGSFEEGEKFKVEFESVDYLSSGQWTVKTVGANASNITVERKVYDANGNLLYDNYFYSSYSKQNEVIYVGPNPDKAAIKKAINYTDEN